MAYVPLNINVYTAAFAGAMAGINVPNGAFITDPDTDDYATQADVAAAFAAAVDTAWGETTVANSYDIEAIEGASNNTFVRGAGNPFNTELTNPDNWANVADAIVAMVLQGDTNATAQGITLPPIPTGGGGTIVASFFKADVDDVSTEPALNGVFYTATANGWFRLTWVLTTFGDFAPGVDSAQINAFIGAPSVDSPQLSPSLKLYQGGEGTQGALFCTPADVYLKTGQTLQLQGAFGTHMTVGIQLTQVTIP